MFYTREELEKIGFKSIGENVLISDKASIYNAKNISIGSNVRIDDFCILSAGDGGIEIGDYVHIACYSSLIGKGSIILKDFSGLSIRVTILSSSDDYSGEYLTNPMINDPSGEFTYIKHSDVILEKHALVGSGAILLPGVVIGEGASVGAMSLVKNNIDPFTIVAGVPSKFIKDRSKKLLELEKKFRKI